MLTMLEEQLNKVGTSSSWSKRVDKGRGGRGQREKGRKSARGEGWAVKGVSEEIVERCELGMNSRVPKSQRVDYRGMGRCCRAVRAATVRFEDLMS